MAICDTESARRLFEGVVESPALQEAYLKLLESGGCPSPEATSFLGGDDLVQGLVDRGMAHDSAAHAGATHLVAAPPALAYQGLLRAMINHLRDEAERTFTGLGRLSGLDQAEPAQSPFASELVEIIEDRAKINRLSYSLINSAQHDFATLETGLVETPLEASSACLPPPGLGDGVRCRAIYERSFLDHPVGLKIIEASVAAGEEARLLPSVGSKIKIVDSRLAMVPLTPTGMGAMMLIRSPVAVELYCRYFELLWERAVPFGAEASAGELTQTQRRVLGLMAEDLSDHQIGSRMDITENSVRRHIAAIRKALGAEQRFGMCLMAMRRGWIK